MTAATFELAGVTLVLVGDTCSDMLSTFGVVWPVAVPPGDVPRVPDGAGVMVGLEFSLEMATPMLAGP